MSEPACTNIVGKIDLQPYLNELGMAVFTKLGLMHDLVRIDEISLNVESGKHDGVDVYTVFHVTFRDRVRSTQFSGAGAVAWDLASRDWLMTESEVNFIREMVRLAKIALCGKDWT